MPLSESQFEMNGFRFGRGTDVEVSVFEEGAVSSTTNDTTNPISDGINFGYDFHQGRILTFEMWSNKHSASEGSQTVSELARAWTDPHLRQTARKVSELRVRAWGSPERIVYGRPRNYSAPNNAQIRDGIIQCVAEFYTVDGNYYDSEARNVYLSLISEGGTGGIAWPVEWPLTWSGTYERQDATHVASPMGAYPVITFKGPVSNPALEYVGTGIRIRWTGTLAYDESVTIDTRPWVRTVKKQDGSNHVGKLTGARMAELQLPQGSSTFRYSGDDQTGQSTCQISYRNTHKLY
ncbi:hypothetical protein ACFYOC_24135 [Nocardiopsis alba]|uniref:hypothetical protein n=1 Tax=Nocardiopsis alba TaxID=53437 RepID=UPI00368FDBCC